jgi:hypothetical protein
MGASAPASERRTLDQARASLLKASGNYGGNQPNYGVRPARVRTRNLLIPHAQPADQETDSSNLAAGFGATYWSYGREDNGSLPLDTLSTDDALLEWGVCGIGLAHVGFYLGNYVAADGSINYYSWGAGQKDSISDLGRLIDQYLKAVPPARVELARS